ncbi:TonB-dependent receptor domain-containing protein, partial [Klebsiella pneumoniae]|uniref:TonB-dependent receptor domain-containing protein n=1 Tax=Klebsiella pneumoniae TaxID=573 RepID=UPI00214B5E8E
TDAWNVYLSAGRGFETPTINELSYRSDNQSGLNFGLKPSTNDSVVLSVTRIQGGNTWNVLPESVELEGTLRTHSSEVQQRVKA